MTRIKQLLKMNTKAVRQIVIATTTSYFAIAIFFVTSWGCPIKNYSIICASV